MVREWVAHIVGVAASKKTVTALGLVLAGVGTVFGAISLDSWARERYPWLPAAGIGCTSVGGLLTTFGRGIADRRPVGRAEEHIHTTEMAAIKADPPAA